MITPAYICIMARYNAVMNCQLYAAAGRLGEAGRRLDRGAFWGSIHGTLSHLMWADQNWMSRFAGWDRAIGTMKESARYMEDFASMQAARTALDARLEQWAAAVAPDWLQANQNWYSGSAQRELTQPRTLLVAHMFNHQTHHRGHVHAMITAAGESTGDTDLFLLA